LHTGCVEPVFTALNDVLNGAQLADITRSRKPTIVLQPGYGFMLQYRLKFEIQSIRFVVKGCDLEAILGFEQAYVEAPGFSTALVPDLECFV